MRRLLLLTALCMAATLVCASVALAQTRGPSGSDGTYNCEDFDDQGQAQEFSLSDPGDTNGLDEDGDGIVCESLPTVTPDGTVPPEGEATASPTASAEADEDESATATATAESDDDGSASASASALPETGGVVSPAALSVVAALLLVGGGIMSASIARRK